MGLNAQKSLKTTTFIPQIPCYGWHPVVANEKFLLSHSNRSQRISNFYPNFIQTREMVKMEEEKPLTDKEEQQEKEKNSLLNYEYDEADDGVDWEV